MTDLERHVTVACSRVLQLEEETKAVRLRVAEKRRVVAECRRALHEQEELAEAKTLNHQRLAQAIEEMQARRDKLAEQNTHAREALRDMHHQQRVMDATQRQGVREEVDMLAEISQHSSTHDPDAVRHTRQHLLKVAHERAALRKLHSEVDSAQKAVDKKIASLLQDQHLLAKVLRDVA